MHICRKEKKSNKDNSHEQNTEQHRYRYSTVHSVRISHFTMAEIAGAGEINNTLPFRIAACSR